MTLAPQTQTCSTNIILNVIFVRNRANPVRDDVPVGAFSTTQFVVTQPLALIFFGSVALW